MLFKKINFINSHILKIVPNKLIIQNWFLRINVRENKNST